jgi:hypothetical protein
MQLHHVSQQVVELACCATSTRVQQLQQQRSAATETEKNKEGGSHPKQATHLKNPPWEAAAE